MIRSFLILASSHPGFESRNVGAHFAARNTFDF